jgi:hypothetical protein
MMFWDFILVAVIGVLIGALITVGYLEYLDQKKLAARERSIKAALCIEITLSGALARTFLQDPYYVPSYRLPTTFGCSGLVELLRDGKISDSGAASLVLFYSEVDAFNRGLDEASNAATNEQLLERVKTRNRMKAKRLKEPDGELYGPALKALGT